jgi:hypothetical protein
MGNIYKYGKILRDTGRDLLKNTEGNITATEYRRKYYRSFPMRPLN